MTLPIDHEQLQKKGEREQSLTDARARLRAERAQLASDREECERLLVEVQDAARRGDARAEPRCASSPRASCAG